MSRSWNEEPQSLHERRKLENDCVRFFKEQTIFDRILNGFREKYLSYGSFSGTVTVRIISEQERESLEGFFGRSYHGQKSASISAVKFEKALKDSRFDIFTAKEVLEIYFKESMIGKKEKQEKENRIWQQMLSEMKISCAGTPAQEWIAALEKEKGNSYVYLKKCYRESGFNIQEVMKMVNLGIEILNQFPYRKNTSEYLAVFAAMLTGNPHAFDDGTKEGQFFDILVSWDAEERRGIKEVSSKYFAFEKQRRSLAVGVLRDDISNYVMISGIHAKKKNGESHAGMEGFSKEGDSVQIPLSVLAEWKSVECPNNEIYIVENPSVFAMLCKKWRGQKACMCMNGQPRLSSVLMLDLLGESNVTIYYAGDFDPEGILIAWKVKQYYKGTVLYWHMSVGEYEKSCSKQKISEKRMKMLERITDLELSELLTTLRKKGLAGYQENIMEVYWRGDE